MKSTRIIGTSKQGMLDNDGHAAVRNKIALAQVVVQHGAYRMYGLRWKERDIILPAHLLTSKERVIQVTLPIGVGDGGYAMTQTLALVYHCDFENDIAIARIKDLSIPASKDITKYFHRESQMRLMSEALLMKRAGGVNEMTYFGAALEYFAGNVSIQRHNGKSVDNTPNVALEFYLSQFRNIPTKAGDCGSPYISMDSALNTAMIIGLHTNRDVSGKRTWGSVISQEYLQRITGMAETERQGFYANIKIPFDTIEHPNFEPLSDEWIMEEEYQDALNSLETETHSDVFYDAQENPTSELVFLGYESKHRRSWAGKPSHKPVPWQQELTTVHPSIAPLIDPQGYPSLTSPWDHPDPYSLKQLRGQPSLIAEQINMYSDPIPWTPQCVSLLNKALPIYVAKLDADYGREFRLLTEEEVINGLFYTRDRYYGHLDAMDLDTSAGDYPRRFFNITQKRALFSKVPSTLDRDVYYWSNTQSAQAVRASCAFAEQSAIRGTRVVYPATDALKYELQSKPHKARCFQCLSIQDVVLMRRYSGTLQSIVSQRHLDGTCSVGIDPIVGFHQLAQRFRKVSLFGEAGDFTRWDKHMLAPLIKIVLQDMGQRYAESDKEHATAIKNVYKVMADTIVYTLSVADGHWYLKMRGNPSGNVLTAVMNSFINLLMTYMGLVFIIEQHNAFIETADEHDLIKRYGTEFRAKAPLMRKRIPSVARWIAENFDCVFYGDDKLTMVHPDYLWLVNFYAFRSFYNNVLGIDYDSPNKDGRFIAYAPLTQLSFLSRTFTDHNGTVFPALKRQTVNAFLYWSRENTVEQWRDLFDAALHEAVLHGEEYYNQYRAAILWILDWCRKHSKPVDYVPPLYQALLQETVIIIRNGRSPGSALTAADRCVNKEIEINGRPSYIVTSKRIQAIIKRQFVDSSKQSYKSPGCIETGISMGQHQSAQREAIMSRDDVFIDLIAIHRKLLQIFDDWHGEFLLSYHSFPALVRSAAGNVVSIGFTAGEYDLSYSRRVQSDLAKYVCEQVGLRVKLITICDRILGPNAVTTTPIWQVQFIEQPTTPSSRLMATGFVLNETSRASTTQAGRVADKEKRTPTSSENWSSVDPLTIGASLKSVWHVSAKDKDNTKQSTGTAGMGMIEEVVNESSSDATMPVTQGTARGVLTKAPIWHLNMVGTIESPRETADSPLAVKMATAVHTVVDKVSYGDVSKFPTMMRLWALAHESGAPTIYIEYTFISAATIVNQLVVGIADTNKSTYTMEELQQIEGVVINPQQGTISVPLRLAAVTTDNTAPTRVTMSQTAINGTDESPIQVPTLVILTATAIQNAYANDDVQVNIRKKAWFGNVNKEPWFITSRSLASAKALLGPSPTQLSTSAFVSMSSLLGLPRGYPLYVTLDGAYLQDHEQLPLRVSTSKSLPIIDKTTNLGSVQYTLMIAGSNDLEIAYMVNCNATGGCVWTAEQRTGALLSEAASNIAMMSSGDNAETNMRKIFSRNEATVFLPASTALIFGQGEAPLPPSTATVNCARGEWNVNSLKSDLIDVWLSGLDEGWSYTVSELAVPERVPVYYRRKAVQTTLFKAYDANNTMLLSYKAGDTANAPTWLADRPSRPFNMVYVIELAHPSQGACTAYVGYSAAGFPDAASGHMQYLGDSTYESVWMTGFNVEDLTLTHMNDTSNRIRTSLLYTTFKPARGVASETDLSNKPARVIEVLSRAVSTLGNTMSRLVFANTLPKTIPATIAQGQGAVEVRDDYCYQQLRLHVQRSGVVANPDQVLVFQLFMRSGVQVVATVVYDMATNEMYVVNNPSVDADRYKTMRKLTAEDVYVGNFRTVEKASSVITPTNTTQWIDRVVADGAAGVYTGSLVTKLKTVVRRKERTSQAEAMLPLLMAGQQGGNFLQAIMQYIMMKGQMNLQQQQKLEQMEKEFQNKLALQQNQQEWKEKMAGLSNPLAQSAAITSAPSNPGVGFVPASSTSNGSTGGEAPLINLTDEAVSGPQTDNFDQQIEKFRAMLYNSSGLSSGLGEELGHPVSDAAAPASLMAASPVNSVPTEDYVLSRKVTPSLIKRRNLTERYGKSTFSDFTPDPTCESSGLGSISVMPFTE